MEQEIKLMRIATLALTTILNIEELNVIKELSDKEQKRLLNITSELICIKMDMEDRFKKK